MKIGYKIVYVRDNKLNSYHLYWNPSTPYNIEYQVGKYIKAPGNTGLFFFETLDDAKSFLTHEFMFGYYKVSDRFKIYKCKVTSPETIELVARCLRDVDCFWQQRNNKLDKMPLMERSPSGTLITKKLMLIEEVKK